MIQIICFLWQIFIRHILFFLFLDDVVDDAANIEVDAVGGFGV